MPSEKTISDSLDDRPILIRIQEQLDDISLPRIIHDVLHDAAYVIEEYERRLARAKPLPLSAEEEDWSHDFNEHDCGEDTCVCDAAEPCSVCGGEERGEGGFLTCELPPPACDHCDNTGLEPLPTAAIDAKDARIAELAGTLRVARWYFESRADADQPAGCDHPIPNEEMKIKVEIDRALASTRRTDPAPPVRPGFACPHCGDRHPPDGMCSTRRTG